MVFIYIPERESADPPNIADSLSESLVNQYGYWLNPLGTGAVSPRLTGVAICRNAAIESESFVQFDFNNPINLGGFELLHFGIADMPFSGPLQTGGLAEAVLIDSSGIRFARREVPVTRDGNYGIKQILASEFVADSGFNYESVKSLMFWLKYGDERGSWIRLDEGPFFRFNVELGTLYVGAADENNNAVSGKSMYLTNPYGSGNTYTLPFGPQGVNPSGNWIVTILDTQNFLRWQDGSTENPRTFNIGYGQNMSGTAIFKVAGDGQQRKLNLLLPIIGIVSVGAIIYYLYNR